MSSSLQRTCMSLMYLACACVGKRLLPASNSAPVFHATAAVGPLAAASRGRPAKMDYYAAEKPDLPAGAKFSRASNALLNMDYPDSWPYSEKDLTPADSNRDEFFYVLPKFV